MTVQGFHFLVVDDDSTNNLICEFNIRKFYKEAIINLFLEPEKALIYIKNTYSGIGEPIPTVLFLDVNMPTMSGFEFLEEFRKFDPEVKNQFVINMLSSSVEDFNIQAKKYPFVSGFLSKPLKISHLENILKDNFVKVKPTDGLVVRWNEKVKK